MCRLLRKIAMLKVISRANALRHTSGCKHACHVMIHAPVPADGKVFGKYPIKHAVLMQMRFDGRLGFPGGYVDNEETLEEAVNREVKEELGCVSSPVDITSDNYVVSHFYDVDSEKLYLHFFAKQVTLKQFMELERRPENLPNYGYEVLGLVRCPLYILRDRKGGLPAFLQNNFIGNARDQLIIGLESEKLLSKEEIEEVLQICGLPTSQTEDTKSVSQ